MSDIDFDAVGRWMNGIGLLGGPIDSVAPLGGGTQNIVVRFRRGDGDYVLRRGPRHLRPGSNDALRREVRVLEALAATAVPCPRVVAACDDESVLDGAVFYLMRPVEGFNPTVELPAFHASSVAVRHAMGCSAVEALLLLHAVDHVEVGLGDVGKPEGFLDRQVPRWLGELDAHRRHPGYSSDRLPGVHEIAGWLGGRVPKQWTPGIVHGDYHLANLLVEPDSPAVAAIVDWELCTVGDPLLDLGWLLATWPRPGVPWHFGGRGVVGAGGLPTADELLGRYAAGSDRELAHMDWYVVLACFKLAIVLEGTYARSCAGKASRATGEYLHNAAVELLHRAEGLVSGGRAL